MAQFDPMNSARNKGPTEYAGQPGLLQAKADGHMLTPKEKRRMIAQEGIRGAGIMDDLPEDDEHYDAVVNRNRERAQERQPDWSLDDALG